MRFVLSQLRFFVWKNVFRRFTYFNPYSTFLAGSLRLLFTLSLCVCLSASLSVSLSLSLCFCLSLPLLRLSLSASLFLCLALPLDLTPHYPRPTTLTTAVGENLTITNVLRTKCQRSLTKII